MSTPITIATLGMFDGVSEEVNRGGGVLMVPEETKKPTLQILKVEYLDESKKVDLKITSIG